VSATSSAAPSFAATPSGPLAYPKYELGGTLVRDLSSELTGKAHRLLISIPSSFQAEPTRRYPVVFLLNGQWDFPLIVTTAGNLRYDKVFPEALIVGLSYAGEKPDYDQLRGEDYVPTRVKSGDGSERGGGAQRFLSWLETAVIPLMEQEYRADPERRVLAGTSSGGQFALYTLFEKPELFWGYIAVSPSVGWDQRELFRREKNFRSAHADLERRLWLSSCSEEGSKHLAHELAFFKQISGSRYKGLALKIYSVAGARHSSVKAEAFTRALRFIAEPLLPPALN
jgi:predicted alpha/beta superfamily hydrolase